MSNSTTQPLFKVIIIGGGLAGSLLANGLSRSKVNFEVYERQEKNSKREGYQIRLGEATLIGMRACLDQDHIDSIFKHFGRSALSQAPILYDKHFRKIFEPGRDPNYTQSSPISRVILQDALREPLNSMGKIHYRKKFVDYTIRQEFGRDLVEVKFDDGTSDICDVLIAADGNNSRLFEPFRWNLVLMLVLLVYLPGGDMTACVENADAANEEELASCMLGVGFFVNRMTTLRSFESLSQAEKWDAVDGLFEDWSPKQ
ncbi:hypothetical protein CFIO01_00312 [Colletotrichum fioriniae PJ7]|uniref:FAD-binding domain-containing protein n=1 Tax=Colletotrichum fioriniae PJ7 TaxID=1445577 RepID=A0A010QEL7_9PEZI|nr:hypothetical protein CFIO01_00312 [Colletotrichum fioriniae PJ7]